MNNKTNGNLRLAYIIGTYPKLTTTFIDREINGLRQLGVSLQVISIRRPTELLSQEQETIRAGVTYLLPISLLSFIGGHLRFGLMHPSVYWGTFFYLLTRPHPSLRARLKTVIHFCEGVYAAARLHGHPWDLIHAHFVDRAATVALIVSRFLNVPYSVTAHANDIYVNPLLLIEKLSEAKFIATCTGYNQDHLANLGKGLFDHKLYRIYHGLPVNDYNRRTSTAQKENLILAVGQLKEKKGFHYLLRACRILLDQGYNLQCHIVGEGPLRKTLEDNVRQLQLSEAVTLCGALSHPDVIEEYQRANIFVLPSVLGADGDRDGIPNVILEAMAMELPVVSTRHSGIPEVIQDGKNGLLVPTADEATLAQALAQLLDNPNQRKQLGFAARQTVIEKFDIERNAARLLIAYQNSAMP